MPWKMPTLDELRTENRDSISARLGSGPLVPNSVARVLADANAGFAHLTLKYQEWLAAQLLPDTAEKEWLERHAKIWLPGGIKAATFATGSILATGDAGTIVPAGSQLVATLVGTVIQFETTEERTIGDGVTGIPVRSLSPGKIGNLEQGSGLSFTTALSGVDGSAIVFDLYGGADRESDDDLRARILFRIQHPPMGGDADDYVQWTMEVPNVSRAWCSPLEMGMGTVTVRFMTDRLKDGVTYFRAGISHVGLDRIMAFNSFPSSADIMAVAAYLNERRPVAVKDFFVQAPIPEPIDFTIAGLQSDDASTRANIAEAVRRMLYDRGRPAFSRNGVRQPAQTIYAAWVTEAITHAAGVEYFRLVMDDHVMPSNGHMGVLGTITFT